MSRNRTQRGRIGTILVPVLVLLTANVTLAQDKDTGKQENAGQSKTNKSASPAKSQSAERGTSQPTTMSSTARFRELRKLAAEQERKRNLQEHRESTAKRNAERQRKLEEDRKAAEARRAVAQRMLTQRKNTPQTTRAGGTPATRPGGAFPRSQRAIGQPLEMSPEERRQRMLESLGRGKVSPIMGPTIPGQDRREDPRAAKELRPLRPAILGRDGGDEPVRSPTDRGTRRVTPRRSSAPATPREASPAAAEETPPEWF
ncbi:MAG: hypothetical protein IH986_13685, partial [Planctomycetes bacterium]|nr:hypothetical protein [Planctomycetota bacterium]